MQNAAFEEGYKAFNNGLDYIDNPYAGDSIMSVFLQEWWKGWNAAYSESELFS